MLPRKKWFPIAFAVLIIEAVLSGGAFFTLFRLNMLPNQYIFIICIAIVALIALTAFLLFFRMGHGPGKKRRVMRIIAVVVAAAVSVVSVGAWSVTSKVGQTLDDVTIGGTDANSADEGVTAGSTPQITTTDTEDSAIVSSPFVVYISGSDTRSKTLDTSRSDVNILMAVNPVNRQILLLNTPRDYYIPNPAGDGAMDKLTHLGLKGIRNSMQGLADLYDTDIRYYGQINFTGFETLIDAIGGITVNSDTAFTTDDGFSFTAGENQMNGEEALSFARDRHHQASGDNARGEHQMLVIEAVIQKLTGSGADLLMNYSDILNSLSGMISTNFTSADISAFVKEQLSDRSSWKITRYAVTGKGGSEYTYSMPNQKAYVMYQDPEMVATASEMLRKVRDGESL